MKKREPKAYKSEISRAAFVLLGALCLYVFVLYQSKDEIIRLLITFVFIPIMLMLFEMFLDLLKKSNAYIDVKIFSHAAMLQRDISEVWLIPEHRSVPFEHMRYIQLQNIGVSLIIGLRVIVNHDRDSHNENYIVDYQLKTHESVCLGIPDAVFKDGVHNIAVIHKSDGVDFPQTFEGPFTCAGNYDIFPRTVDTRRNRKPVDIKCERVGFKRSVIL